MKMFCNHLNISILIVLEFIRTLVIGGLSANTLPTICRKKCLTPVRNGSVVVERCRGGPMMIDRCCVNNSVHGALIMGIDLSGCDIKGLNGSLTNLPQVITVILTNNPLPQPKDSEFSGLQQLDYLSLPSNLKCPGGSDVWNVSSMVDNQTLCEGQIDYCTANNSTCPSTSHCVPNGPGLNLCLCKDGLHGYKCLRKGEFPVKWYTGGLIAVTLFLSAILWVTQRRHVGARKED